MEEKKGFRKPIVLEENTHTDPVFENMMKKFKRESEPIIREIKARRYYIKPSEAKRLKRKSIKKL